ncbi:adhesin [Pseudomonas spirodelae]|uniref:Adhesin n=1 Tax=Pseudomonas spirodelae TaxID=3101751 RepID=A0ABU5P4B7_9PSED|nr:adhesin [Pseudomonas sp. T5W1]MBU0806557.1 adhesin [Gammaproteobacteria bacterium]MBU0883071.1 adhesin [Gammaproteobacteria bacterium]MBU1858432.1 adhesin [Gammaproteobacteria bacterium]MEA1604510.1 adhesin [Pseudomonas sp. T5W1]
MRQLTLFLASALCSQLLLAEPAMQATASLNQSGQNHQGVLMINQAAGDAQQQANARAIAIGSGVNAQATATTNVKQNTDHLPINPPGMVASASIGGSSFANSNGVVGINQGAGSGNQQINAMRITSGLAQGLDDSALAQQSVRPSSISGAAEPLSAERIVSVDDSAFSNSRGVVQLNQSAGVGNRSINSLGIRITE